MGEKSKFQKELERMASRQIILSILAGCLLFSVAIFGISRADQYMRQERHLEALERNFQEIYESASGFLKSEENEESFMDIIRREKWADKGWLRYQLSGYNIDAPVGMNLLLTDVNGHVVFSSFSEEELNLHRLEFNRIAEENAVRLKEELYTTVYFFSGETSEYVILRPMYKGRAYVGSVAAYLKGEEWGKLFLKYQYDTILTTRSGEILFCSNPSFLPERAVNKYRRSTDSMYLEVEDSRYRIGERTLHNPGVQLYSFIYVQGKSSYFLIGILTILGLGVVWGFMFFHLLRQMAGKTSESVQTLVQELRVIRKEDPDHVVQVETEDEIEEIAVQVNKMMASMRELNQKNLELAEINNRMEIQNLQAQLNPHFIYNTLDNIRYLIVQDAAKADELIGRFTRILRYSINNTKQNVSLQEDMEYIEDYLVIQKTRFGNRFSYRVDMEPECETVLLPKLLLQPLLENSLKYGFKKKNEICVNISGRIEGEYLVLRVKDNGAGQPKTTMETLRSMLSRGEINTVHNGLQNIHRRIVLEYGHESGLTLESQEGSSFLVTVKLWTGGRRDV